jgi:tetratricopeptide (TPR) repeat protein
MRVVPPTGFKLRSLPKQAELQFGPLNLVQSFRQEADGSVTGTIRADSVRGRYTADEGRAFRDAWLKAESSLLLAIRFDHEAWLLARNGKPAAALRSHEALIAAEPKKAMPRVRLAAQLLEFGLVEEAKLQAERATRLEPRNALAFNMLGLVLQHDGLGRRFGGPYDRVESLRALREATSLDPDNLDMKMNLAATAEHDAAGVRFGKGSDIDLAIENYEIIVAQRPHWQLLREFLIYALWREDRYEEVISVADKAEKSEFAAGARLAARVVKAGAETALHEDASRTNAATHRARAGAALFLLWEQRRYEEARNVVAAAGVDGLPPENSGFIDMLDKIVRAEDLPAPAPAPTAAGNAECQVSLMLGGAGE